MRRRRWWEIEWYVGQSFRLHTFKYMTKQYGRYNARASVTLGRFHALLTWSSK